MFKSFSDFLPGIPPLVKDFISQSTNNTDLIYVDWWCVPDKKMLLNTIFGLGADRREAEKFESVQRTLPQEKKLLSDYFLLEFKFNFSTDNFSFFLVGIDMKRKEVYCKNETEKSLIDKAFDFSLKKHFPVRHTSRKLGL